MLFLFTVALIFLCKIVDAYRLPQFGIHRLTAHQPFQIQNSQNNKNNWIFDRNVNLRYTSALFAKPRVGNLVIAEVDDIAGGMESPRVLFNVCILTLFHVALSKQYITLYSL